ncbi:caprin-1-like isoform X2 [Engraulis encrasicolus]|uniref:caprin-1-like isoform X2 n=1 Tax=Engraulis encrasicolus TaxID=184585 RepID=UPI002FD14916
MPAAMNGESSVPSTSPELGVSSAPGGAGGVGVGGPAGASGGGAQSEQVLKQILTVIEKKVRNMEKKKSKLDDYNSKKTRGESLNADQLEALSKAQEVGHNLDFARELQKNFMALGIDLQKAERKAWRREQLRREEEERRRLQKLLEVQLLLEQLQEASVCEELREETPPVLTHTQITHLHDFSRLVHPQTHREHGTRLAEQFEEASVHMWELLEGKDKPVIGTTYKALKESVDQVLQSDYFQRLHTHRNGACAEQEQEEDQEEEEEEQEEEEEGPVEEVNAPSESSEAEEQPEPAVEEEAPEQDYTEELVDTTEFVNRQLVPEVSQSSVQEETSSEWNQEAEVSPPLPEAPPTSDEPAPPVSVVTDPVVRKQALQDLMATMQGTYNFMQDSVLDFDGQVIDPAIVSVQTTSPAHSLDRMQMSCTVQSESQHLSQASAVPTHQEVFNCSTPPMAPANEVEAQNLSSQYQRSFSPSYSAQPAHSEEPSDLQPAVASFHHSQDALQAAGVHQSQQPGAGPTFFGGNRGAAMSRGGPRPPRGGYRGGYDGYRPPFPSAAGGNYGHTQFGNAPREYNTYSRDSYHQQGYKRGGGQTSRGQRGHAHTRS